MNPREGGMDAGTYPQGRRTSQNRRGCSYHLVETKAGSVKIGIEDPPEVTIVRDDARTIR